MSTFRPTYLMFTMVCLLAAQTLSANGFASQIFTEWQNQFSIELEKKCLGCSTLFIPPPATTTVSVRVNAGSDDAEEHTTSGAMALTSSDLELTIDGTASQFIGMRFNGMPIPAGATITNAYVEFECDEVSTGYCNNTIWGEAADNPGTFTTSTDNISLRNTTTSFVTYEPSDWNTVNQQYTTPDLSSVIQEIVDRPGWASGNSMVIIMSGTTGKRTAESYDGEAAAAPLLVVEYTSSSPYCPNVIVNNEFDNGTAGWVRNQQSGSTATISVDNSSQLSGANSALIDISTASGTKWHIQFVQTSKSIDAGKNYNLTFDAKAVANRNISVSLQRTGSPHTTYWWQDLSLTTSGSTFSYDFSVDSTNAGQVGLFFQLGESSDNVWIDNVSFSEICPVGTEICDNGIDDDGDGDIDCDDSDCSAACRSLCVERTIGNDTQCNEGQVYGFWIRLDGEEDYHRFESGTFREYSDGTAELVGTIVNLSDSGIRFDVDVQLSGRTDVPDSGPKLHECHSVNTDAWYYYTAFSGTLTGLSDVTGALIEIERYGEAFQVGVGANSTQNVINFSASGWLTLNLLSQSTGSVSLSLSTGSGGQHGDININLSGDESDITNCTTEICDNFIDDDGDGQIDCDDSDCPCFNGELEFCTYNLELQFNETFNIRDYVHDKDNPSAILDWSQIYFTYTAAGANNPTTPNDWRLADFNNGNDVTVTAADAAPGTGNDGDGEYRIYLVRNGETSFDDKMRIRITASDSNKEEAKCNDASEICDNNIDDDGDGLIDCADPDCGTISNIDFETDANGNPLNNNDDPSERWAASGVHFSSNDPAHALSIFDSQNPPSWETDAGTPNTDFGGNGVGAGGGSGMLGENSQALNKMLIISDNATPSQGIFWQGGQVNVDFDMPAYIAGVEIVDIGYNEVDGRIRAYDGGGALLSEQKVYGFGENSYQKVAIQTGNVRKLEIDIPHSLPWVHCSFATMICPQHLLAIWFGMILMEMAALLVNQG